MNVLSAPPIVMAGVTFYVGLYHLSLYFRRAGHREDLTFALTCFAMGLYDVFSAGLYSASSVAEGMHWQRAQVATLGLVSAAFLWFVTDYVSHASTRWAWALSAYFTLAAVVGVVERSGLAWLVDQPDVKQIQLSFGFGVTYYELTPGPLTNLQSVMGMVLLVYTFGLGVRFYRSGQRREAKPLLVAMVFSFSGVVNDTAVSSGLYHFVYLTEYFYLGMVLLMAYSLSNAVVEATVTKEALQASEEKYRILFESSPDSITLVGLDGIVLDCNDATVEIGGLPKEQMIDQPFTELGVLDRGDMAKHVELLSRLASGEPVGPLEIKAIRGDGESHWLEVFPVLLKKEGRAYAIQVISRDVTERVQAGLEILRLNQELEGRVAQRTAQLEAANEQAEAFAYSVSHDLRAPLRAIDGFSLALLEDYGDRLDSGGRGHLRRVRAASQRMGQLIDDLLKLSRLTRDEMRHEAVDLSALTREIATELQQVQPGRRVEFVITPGLVTTGDARLLRVVLANLLGNAWKFTAKRSQARIEFGLVEVEGQPAYFVRDDGVGFDMTYASKLFGAFQRLHTATEFEGNGIGLATVRRVVQRHGGRVWATGTVDKGATFYFTLASANSG